MADEEFKRMSYRAWGSAIGELLNIQRALADARLPKLSDEPGDDNVFDRLKYQQNPAAAGYLLAKLAGECSNKEIAERMTALAETLQEFEGVDDPGDE
jgi:hypothetical protein